MARVRREPTKNQSSRTAHATFPLDDGTLTTPVTLAMIQALIPLGLRAVEEALQAEVAALAGARYGHGDGAPGVVRWGKQAGSIYLADQKLAITVPRVRDQQAGHEVPLTTYQQLQTPRAHDVGLCRRVLGGLSCREYEAAAEAVPEAFGLARASVSRRFIRARARELRRLQERSLGDAPWLVLVLDGNTFAGDQMLCLADRGLLGFDLWQQAVATGAALVWRAKASVRLPALARFADGSYRSELCWNSHCASADRRPIPVRVVEYTLAGGPDAESRYRLVTSILDPERAPAAELAVLYHERWEIETAFDEFKTHLRGARRVLRSKTPDLVRQEAWGFLLAHFAIRALMHEAALGAGPRARDPDTLSFTHALRITRRTLPHLAALPPLRTDGGRTRPCSTSSARSRCTPVGDAPSRVASNGK